MSEETYPCPSDSTDFRDAHSKRTIDNMLTQIGIDAVEEHVGYIDETRPIDEDDRDAINTLCHEMFDSNCIYTVDKDRLLSYYPNLLDALSAVYQGAAETIDDYNDWAEEQMEAAEDAAKAEDLKSDKQHAAKIHADNTSNGDWVVGPNDPEIIMLSTGYAELWPDGDVVQHGSVIFNVCA